MTASSGAQPETRAENFFLRDRSLRALLAQRLPDEIAAHLAPHFARLGALASGRLDRLAATADTHPPKLAPRARDGRDDWRIALHPAYEAMEDLAFGDFALARLSHAPALGLDAPAPPIVKYVLTLLFAEAEFGLLCPVNLTDSTARILSRFGAPAQRAAWLPRLTATARAERAKGAQWVTEIQAGSDVGAIETEARRDGAAWRLHGEKWFASVADCDVALTLARPEGAPAGVHGLAMFLVPRRLADGAPNGVRCLRLKDKLGSRSMATGEMRFEGAHGELVGEASQGFRQMMAMISQSRLSNAARSAGLMRRSLWEAFAVARGRAAFGRPLIEAPLMARQLQKLILPAEQALSMTLFAADLLARADQGEARAARALRLATPLIKYRATRDARAVAGDAMEIRGGSGYVEEWPHGRLLRDAHLGSIWEGTTNVVALDVLRAISRDAAHEALRAALLDEAPPPRDPALSTAATERLGAALRFAEARALAGDEAEARGAARALYDAASAHLFIAEADRAEPNDPGFAAERRILARRLIARLARLETEPAALPPLDLEAWSTPQ